jgi:hypothetical protein
MHLAHTKRFKLAISRSRDIAPRNRKSRPGESLARRLRIVVGLDVTQRVTGTDRKVHTIIYSHCLDFCRIEPSLGIINGSPAGIVAMSRDFP